MNALRYAGSPGPVESYFLRLNDPAAPRAAWVKLTVLAPLQGPAVLETWFVAFDGPRVYGHRDTLPFADPAWPLSAGSYRLDLDGGHVEGRCGEAAFNLDYAPRPGVGASLSIFPFDWMLSGPFPKSKLVTPVPFADFRGSIDVFGERWDASGWTGMQGHNWGREHAPAYAWGQCTFDGEVPAMVEAFSGKIRLGSRLSPWISALVLRHGTAEYRFDNVVDLWRQEPVVGDDRWTLRVRGASGEVRLRMSAAKVPSACLGYRNPDGTLAYCFNSKLADTLVEVEPRRGAAFHLSSPHGGAVEFLRPETGEGEGI